VAIAWNKLTGRTHDLSGPVARTRTDNAPQATPTPQQRKRKAG